MENLRFQIFKKLPEFTTENIGAGSSLQMFESCLLLISQRRFPHALTILCSSIEALIKSQISNPNKTGELKEQLDWASQRSPTLNKFNKSIHEVRKLRNEIVHTGYSTKDDDVCIQAITKTGIPFYRSLVRTFLNIELTEILIFPIGDSLIRSEKLQRSKQFENDFNFIVMPIEMAVYEFYQEDRVTPYLESFSHLDKRDFDLQFALRETKIASIDERLVIEDCPICGEEALVILANHKALGSVKDPYSKKKFVIDKYQCVNCGFYLSPQKAQEFWEITTTRDEQNLMLWALFEEGEDKGPEYDPMRHASKLKAKYDLCAHASRIISSY